LLQTKDLLVIPDIEKEGRFLPMTTFRDDEGVGWVGLNIF
jgi:hypothetical protein